MMVLRTVTYNCSLKTAPQRKAVARRVGELQFEKYNNPRQISPPINNLIILCP